MPFYESFLLGAFAGAAVIAAVDLVLVPFIRRSIRKANR